MNEWDFTAKVISWVDALIRVDPSLPFREARTEQVKDAQSQQRRDFSLLDSSGRALITGELKLPDKADGKTPYNAKVVADARSKAKAAGASFFITWNVNECVLWETEPAEQNGSRVADARPDYKKWSVFEKSGVAPIRKSTELERPNVRAAIQTWLAVLLRDLTRVLHDRSLIERKSPDEKFIDAFEAALSQPVALTYDALVQRYERAQTRRPLDAWMRDDLGFVITNDPAGIRENLDNAAKHACYTVATRLVFYEGLLRRYGAQLPQVEAPEHVTTADELRLHFAGFFEQAKRVTGDYETVFGERANDLGNRVPFYTDAVLPFWRGFVDELHEFDFSKLDYEVIGLLFERLLAPEERHKYGQYYTRPEVVDLMLAFGVRTGEEAVMDPACGGGTFLVRAYARERELAPHRTHADRLANLYGTDISAYAVNLTTINLATRDLVEHENYPRIGRLDFFDLATHGTIAQLPRSVSAGGLGASQKQDVQIPDLDLVVGNPPYVRQEDIEKGKKDYYAAIAEREGVNLSRRADLHAYFWPHATEFLKDEGHLCFLTSSQWLDVDYGFALQAWMLQTFEVVAIFESVDEPWFVGARVVTAAAILRRQRDPARRDANTVRFVQLRQPIAELLEHDGTVGGAMEAADAFRDEILGLTEDTVTGRYRARLVPQAGLWREGLEMGALLSRAETDEDRYANKWGRYLRAPDLWFRLVDRAGDRLVPLASLVDIRRGITSGKDAFFLPKDATPAALHEHADPTAFRDAYGAERAVVASGEVAIVACGDRYSERRPIEARFLEPIFHGAKDFNSASATRDDALSTVVMLPTGGLDEAPHARRYVEWGEENGWDEASTCKGRVTSTRDWYDLTGRAPAEALWIKGSQYVHLAPLNEDGLLANSRLYEVEFTAEDVAPDVMAGVLNSTWTLLSGFIFGRPTGNEGLQEQMVGDVRLMSVADPRAGTVSARGRVANAFAAMKPRRQGRFISDRAFNETRLRSQGKDAELAKLSDYCELDEPDRHKLDDAVLELMGFDNADERDELRAELYAFLRRHFVAVRKKEEKATANRSTTSRQGRVTPTTLAREVVSELQETHPTLLRHYEDLLDLTAPFHTYDVPVRGEPVIETADVFTPHAVAFRRGSKRVGIVPTAHAEQQRLVHQLALHGVRGIVRVPLAERASAHVRERHADLMRRRAEAIRSLIAERVQDPGLHKKVSAKVSSMLSSRY